MTESGDIFIWLPSVHSTGYGINCRVSDPYSFDTLYR
jgi:hypothetical protein